MNLAKFVTKGRSKRKNLALTGGGALAVLLIVFLLIAGVYYLFVPSSYNNQHPYLSSVGGGGSTTVVVTTGQASQSVSGNTCSPVCADYLSFNPYDPLAGAAVVSTTITVYPVAGTNVGGVSYGGQTASDSGTGAGSGAGGYTTGSNGYTSGSSLVVKISKSGYVTEYQQITVPQITPSMAAAGTAGAPVIRLPLLTLGTGVIKVTDSASNSYVTNATRPKSGVVSTATAANQATKYGVYNFTTSATSSVTFTMQLINSAANSGWWSTQDVINNINQNLVAQVYNINGSLSLTGLNPRVQIGTGWYWPVQMIDGYSSSNQLACAAPNLVPPYASCPVGFTQQTIGSTAPGGGSQSFQFTVNKGALTAGQAYGIAFSIYDYANIGYFQNNGNYGPNAAVLVVTFQIWVAV